MAKPETKTEFFYTEKGLVAIDSPVKLQILNLLREEPKTFDEIVRYTAKAKSTISVHLNDLRSCNLVDENFDPEDRRKKIYSLTSCYMGCSQEPSTGNYRCLLDLAAANGNDRFRFMETMFHVFRFGFEAYGIDNSPVVKMIGIDIGKHLSLNFESSTLEALLNEVAGFLEFHEDCQVSVLMENSLALRVDGGFKAMSLPVTGKPFCSLKEGIIEGILKEKLGKECGVLEIECYGTGHEHCLFEITI